MYINYHINFIKLVFGIVIQYHIEQFSYSDTWYSICTVLQILTLIRLWQCLAGFNKVGLMWSCSQSSVTIIGRPTLPCSVVWRPLTATLAQQLVPLSQKGNFILPPTPSTPLLLPPTHPLICSTHDIRAMSEKIVKIQRASTYMIVY